MPTSTIRILHLSDTHFGTEIPAVVTALLDFAREAAPDLVLLSGDITQRARSHQFRAADEFVRALPAPVLAVPGNHDIPLFNLLARWRHPYANYRRVFGDQLEPEVESEQLLVIGVNSTRPRRHKNGEISAAQIERVATRLRQARPGQLRVVVQHHPVSAVTDSDLSNLARGRGPAVNAWLDAGLDLLLAGHIHLPYIRALAGPGGRKGWTVQAGTSLSWRLRDNIPNSLNLIDHSVSGGRHQCLVERWDYAATSGHFARAEARNLALDRGRAC